MNNMHSALMLATTINAPLRAFFLKKDGALEFGNCTAQIHHAGKGGDRQVRFGNRSEVGILCDAHDDVVA